ncbi:MAG: arginyl-tRNA synthetase, partial [Lacisediminihabitans sp.]
MPGIRRLVVPLAVAALGLAALSGCVPTGTPTPGASDTATTPTGSASATVTPSPTTSPSSTPITIGCSTLITPDALYAFNPNFGLLT